MIEYTVEVYDNGSKHWYLYGELHREDGPAIERPDGYKAWFLNDVRYTEEEYYNKLNPKAKELTMSELVKELGYKVKIVEAE